MESLVEPALAAVKSGELKLIPATWEKTYLQWLTNIQDWCISRQLWWGHRLPVWYNEEKITMSVIRQKKFEKNTIWKLK